MTDRENVIARLQESAAYFRSSFDALDGTVACEKFRRWTGAIEQAIALLKAHEPIVPIRCSAHAQGADDVWYECGKCHKFLGVSRYSKRFCANCGRAVKWE